MRMCRLSRLERVSGSSQEEEFSHLSRHVPLTDLDVAGGRTAAA